MRTLLIWTFFCLANAASAQTTFFSETFDSTTEPSLPATVVSADESWKASSSSSSPGSGANNAVHTGSAPGMLVFGPIDLSAALDGTFSYWARRTSSYSADSLFVRASSDGANFDVMLFGGGLPASASTWEEISVVVPAALLGASSVYLEFEGRGGSSSGSNMRIDDLLIEGTANASLIDTAFGFGADAMTWDLSSATLGLDLGIEWPGPDTLQGLQFDLTWDDAVVSVDSVALGAGLGSPASWMLSSSLGAGAGTVALLGLLADGLPPVTHPSVLVLHVSAVSGGSATTSLAITGFLATSNTPTADELPLPNGHRSLALTLQPALASAVFSNTTLDFGSVVVGDSAVVSVSVSNPTGSADLLLSGTPSPLALDVPDPIAPSGSADLLFRYVPLLADGGSRVGSFSLTHNTAAAATVFDWSALVLGGRGDTDADGAFDVADIVLSLDGTVSPASIPSDELARHDVFPFPLGDGALDIRDVTVAIQAILRNQWPDGSALPQAPSSAPLGKGVDIALVQTADSLWLSSPIELRGAQLEVVSNDPLPVAPPAKRGATMSQWHDPSSGVQRILMLAGVREAFSPGHILVATVPQGPMPPSSSEPVRLNTGVAVDRFGGKHPIVFRREDGLPELPEPDLDDFTVYPNPLPAGSPLSLDLPPFAITDIFVFDALGRRLFSTGDRIPTLPPDLFPAPGTYFVRVVSSHGRSLTRSIVVSR